MKKILGYKFFNTSEDFEKWQSDNPECQITQVTPYFNGLSADTKDEDHMKFDVSPPIVFVVFFRQSGSS